MDPTSTAGVYHVMQKVCATDACWPRNVSQLKQEIIMFETELHSIGSH